MSHIPGGAMAIELSPRWKLTPSFGRGLHAVVSAIIGNGHTGETDFALIATRLSPSGWGLYVYDVETAVRIAGAEYPVTLHGRDAILRLGALHRIRVPPLPEEPTRVAIDTVTPVVVKSYGGRVLRGPTGEAIGSALDRVAKRIGMPGDGIEVKVESSDTEYAGEEWSKLGDVVGWEGRVVATCSPRARQLLSCAAVVGLGSRVAFGFGRVVIRGVESEPLARAEHASPREKLAELFYLLTPRQRDVLEIFAEAQRAHRPRPAPRDATGRFFVTPHAVRRFIERWAPACSYEEALGACITLGDTATFTGEANDGKERWETRTADGRTVRFIVGRAGGSLPQMVTIEPDMKREVAAG